MDTSQAFASKFLKCEDLKGASRRAVIDRVEFEEVGQKKDQKLVVYFKGKDKGLVLNKTNWTILCDLCESKDSDNWTGREIQLNPDRTTFEGKLVDTIRVDANFGRKQVTREAGDEDAPF